MIRAIFFDLDDTLIRYDAAYETALRASHITLAARFPHVSRNALRTALYDAYEKRFGYGTPGFADLGILTVRELREILTADALLVLNIPPEAGFIDRLIESHETVERKEIQLFVDTPTTLDALGERLLLGVITNGPSAMQRAKLTELGLADRFTYIVVDTEFGHSKPDARIFSYAESLIRLRPDELIFVGNSPEADIAGAVAAGWTSVWLNADNVPLPIGVPAPHYTVRRLSELLSIPPVVEVLKQRD